MSWSILMYGTKEKLALDLGDAFDKAAANYKGTEEEKDVLAVKERALSVVAAFEPKPSDFHNALSVNASGSRYSGNASFRLEVLPVHFA